MKSSAQRDDPALAPDNHERRTIEELIARYELEPTIHDVYVEGELDEEIVEQFLKTAGLAHRAAVYEVQTVNVPRELVEARGFDVGNKGRILTLGLTLCERVEEASRFITCIVDVDFDDLNNERVDSGCIIYTDYISMEFYLLSEPNLARLSERYLRRPSERICTALNELTPSLQELFLIRAAKGTLEFNHLRPPNVLECLSRVGGRPNLDHLQYVRVLLQKGGMMRRYEIFQGIANSYRPMFRLERRHNIHFDDAIDVVCWIAKRLLNVKFALDTGSLKRALMIVMDMGELSAETLFISLTTRIQDTRRGS